MYQQITIKTLAKQNKKQTEIAVELGCHRNTVRNIIKRESVIEKGTRNKSSYFDQYRDQIKGWLDKKVSHLRIYELLHETEKVERTYDSLCKYIQKEFPKTPSAFGVQVTSPGEMAEVDFGYAGLLPINAPGETKLLAKTWFLSVRLNYSRLAYREMTHDQKVTTFIKGITNAFTFFGGVPKRLKIDNLRSAISKNQHYDLQFNADFLEWANHEGVVINPCVPYHPEQKGGVESDMKYIENNFLVERHFDDFTDLQFQFEAWSINYANKRIHGITRRIPSEVFASEEKQTLQPLPVEMYATFERYERKVQSNCHVFFQNHYYSVPARLVSQMVTVRYGGSLLKVTHRGTEVACHLISSEVGGYTTSRSHLPDFKCYGVTEYQQKYEAKMADIGESAQKYFQEILVNKDSYWFRSVRVILGLAHEYGNEAVNLSLSRALQFRVTDTNAIKRIVTQRLYLLDIAPRLLASQSDNRQIPTSPVICPPFSTFLSQVLQKIEGCLSTVSENVPRPESKSAETISIRPRDLDYYQQLLTR
ncbi:MAG: IS21 family transposase [Gammaproteobacteria bacterium]|nr:IS21 family transposase [Gammaproteobacteria bacterium]